MVYSLVEKNVKLTIITIFMIYIMDIWLKRKQEETRKEKKIWEIIK